jgi:ATP-dependent exoDNAse (exonuclease V) alpha subunit
VDRQRVHVGDRTTTLDAVFNAWQSDRNQGLDSIMLAPTRELVRSLNQRARNHGLTGDTPGRQVELADGNPGRVGDLIITRSNDRRLRVTATDWVKNGDRWTILNLDRTGALTLRQIRNGRTIRLPATYVQESVELGYATTVHTAQGVTADTMHGVVTGEESRQQLYTVLTRGRTANHIYVTVVGDGNPHAIVQPDSLHPRTATELLEQILARDASPQSATTLHCEGRPGHSARRRRSPLPRRPPPCCRTSRRSRNRCQRASRRQPA